MARGEKTAKKQYRLGKEDIEVLRDAQEKLGYQSETDAVRAAVELLRKFNEFTDNGASLAVIDTQDVVQKVEMVGLRLFLRPTSMRVSK